MEKEGKATVTKKNKKKGDFTEKVFNSKGVIWISIIASVLTIVSFFIAIIANASKTGLSVSLNHHNCEMEVGTTDTLIATVEPKKGLYEHIWKSDNETVAMVSSSGVVQLLHNGTATITLVVKEKNGEIVQASCLYKVNTKDETSQPKPAPTPKPKKVTLGGKPNSTALPRTNGVGNTSVKPPQEAGTNVVTTSTIDLGYAIYTGKICNGQPHGNGTLKFRSPHLIPGTLESTAAAGETVIGRFHEGKVNLGTWYRNDGTHSLVKEGQK